MRKGDKAREVIGIWGAILILVLIVVASAFSLAIGSEEEEQEGSLFNTTEPNEVANKSICSVTLITGDVVIVSTLPDERRGFAIKTADSTKSEQNFQIIETPKGTYVFPEGIDLSKVDKELFNIDYLIREEYCNLTYLPVLVDYKDKEEKVFGVAEQKEFEMESNITIVKSYHSIPTFSSKLSLEGIDETFKTLVERPEIKKIWLDKKVHASLYESVPLIGAPELWNSGYNGSGLETAILDTGIDDTHPDLDDLDDNPATYDPKVIVKEDFTDDNTTEDLYGHGTHCAGIAAGTGAAPSEPYSTSTPVLTPTATSTPPSFELKSSSKAEGEDKIPGGEYTGKNLYSIYNKQGQGIKRIGREEIKNKEKINEIETRNISVSTIKSYSGGIPITGGNRTVVSETYSTPIYSKIMIQMDDTEDNDLIQYKYDFNLTADGFNYTFSGSSTPTKEDINETLSYDIDSNGEDDLFRSINISAYTSDNDTLDVMVEAWNGTAWELLYGIIPPAEFNDVYSDYGEDTDGDGLYDFLVINTGVNVTETGRYRVSGSLYENGTYNSLDYAYNTTYLSEGNQTVQLRFEGIKIRNNEYNGTYDLKHLYLYDEEHHQSDYRYYAYTTSYYNYTRFQIPPAEFNDIYADYGEDTDGDGLYDYLTIDVGVNVREAGDYRVRGSLYENGTYRSVDYAYNTTYLSEGNQTVQLRFEGIKIRQNEYNGTYDLKHLRLYNATSPIPIPISERELEQKMESGEISPVNVSAMYGERLDYRYYAYTTSYYNWTEFQKPPAEFNDVYSDYGEDTNGDGLYDYLVVNVGVNVTETGRYRVSGSLYENGTYSYRSVDYDSNTTYLSEGNQTVQLRFEGIKIRQNEYNGTYDLKHLRLYNATSPLPISERELEQKMESGEISPVNVSAMYGERLDYRYYAYTTSYYNWTEFQKPPAEFNDVYSDYGEDTNGDGLYDYLVIEIGVNVTETGRYRVSGSLDENGTYHWVDYAYNTTYLSEGNQIVQLRFEGIKLRNNEYNGTYDLKSLGLYSEWKEDSYKYWKQIDYRYYAYTTGYYNYIDFQEFPRYIGVAPGAYLWNVKVLNQYGRGYESWVIDGVEYAAYGPDGIKNTGDEADIISMSLGGAPTDGTDPLSQAVNDAVDQGLVVAVAAGNAWDYFTIGTPGAAEKVITVGASDKEDELAYFSSKGPTLDLRVKPDVLAPGVDIIAPRANNTTMGYPYNDYYTEASGTSMATPHVAGAAALILQANPNWTPSEVKNTLISTAEDLGYNVYEQGGGRIYVPTAANPKILVNPAAISFKNLDTTSGTITFKNLDTVMHTLTLDVSVREVLNNTEVNCAYLNRTSLSLAPGSSASVLLTINDTSLPHSLYSGKVSATYSGGEVHSIFGFCTLNVVKINKTSMYGKPSAYKPIYIFSDKLGEIYYKLTNGNGTAMFLLPDGAYNIISSGWGAIPAASVYTVLDNVTIINDINLTLDERDVKTIQLDYDSSQILTEKYDEVYYRGENVSVSFGSLHRYPSDPRTFVSPTNQFKGIFVYSYYPKEYLHFNSPEWHKLLFNLSNITEDITFLPNPEELVRRTTDYKVALKPELAEWYMFAWYSGVWSSWSFVYEMNAPLHRIEWLSPYPVSYSGGYKQYAEWWNLKFSDWGYGMTELSYPTGSKPYFVVGEHPFKSGTEIDIPWKGRLGIYGTISEDTYGNRFANYSADVSGNLTVIKDGEVVIDHEDIKDYFWEYVHFYGTPRFNVIIQGNSSPRLSTYTKTELNFTADPTRDYQPPEVTIRVLNSNLYNTVPGGNVKLVMDVKDESNISSVALEYSVDNGTTWNPATITYKGITGCSPISGGNRTVIDETYTIPRYSKVRIFMDDTEDNDEIYYGYTFTLKKSDETEYTKSGNSISTLGDIYDTRYYDEDNNGVHDLFKSICIGAYTEDDDTRAVRVEAWNGSAWECLYGKKIRRYEANLGYMNSTFVSLRANATDSEGNSISQMVIKGFYVSVSEECIPPNESWNVTISATNQSEPAIVGMHPNATDGYDPEFDVYAQTPVQGKVILILDDIYSTSIKKTRCYNESVSWNLSVGVPTGQTTTLSWDVSSNVNLTIFEGDEVLSSGSQLGEGSHELTITAELLEYQEFSIKLKAGWNMVSIPLIPDNNSVQSIFGSIPTLDTMPIKTWESPSFVKVEEVEPKIGYWVFTPEDTTINVTGKSITNTTLILEAGWNMVGTVGMENLTISEIPNQVPQNPAVTWVTPSFVETDIIEPGKSAWVFVTTDTIVTVGKAVSTEVKAKAEPTLTITKTKSAITPATTEEWNLTISATNQLEPVTFGIHPDATNGYDEYDVLVQTPVQGKVILILDDIYATEINRERMTWNLSVGVPTGQTTTLMWDPSKIPADVSLSLDGVDMKLQNSTELGEGSHSFVISGSPIEPTVVFDTGSPTNPYPSISGTHTGTITPSQDISANKLYTYPCAGTGGHTESIELYENGVLIASGTWSGYQDDWHNITITSSVTLLKDHEYNYTIVTGSYPQIIHESSKEVTGGTINCTSFVDTNGKEYTDWIPAIRLE